MGRQIDVDPNESNPRIIFDGVEYRLGDGMGTCWVQFQQVGVGSQRGRNLGQRVTDFAVSDLLDVALGTARTLTGHVKFRGNDWTVVGPSDFAPGFVRIHVA